MFSYRESLSIALILPYLILIKKTNSMKFSERCGLMHWPLNLPAVVDFWCTMALLQIKESYDVLIIKDTCIIQNTNSSLCPCLAGQSDWMGHWEWEFNKSQRPNFTVIVKAGSLSFIDCLTAKWWDSFTQDIILPLLLWNKNFYAFETILWIYKTLRFFQPQENVKFQRNHFFSGEFLS